MIYKKQKKTIIHTEMQKVTILRVIQRLNDKK